MYQLQANELRTLTTAHLAQTMSLLALNVEELGEKIHTLLGENPALELRAPTRCPQCLRPLREDAPCPVCSTPSREQDAEPVVFLSHRWETSSSPAGGAGTSEEFPSPEEYLRAESDLKVHILRQIAPALSPQDRPLAAHLLTSLDEDGLLPISSLEVARYHHVPLSRVEHVLHLIQHADPPGVGAATPSEALLIQLDVLSETRRIPAYTRRIIQEHLAHLGRNQLHEIAQRLGAPLAAIVQAAQFIRQNLNPYPARAHWGDWRSGEAPAPAVYHRPDAIFQLADPQDERSPLVVEILAPLRGQLHINTALQQALQEMDTAQRNAWQQNIERARLLIKCLAQRNQALAQLLRFLAREQRAFILHGDRHLRPITRAEVAAVLGVHESTVSRAVSGKAIQLPNRRIIPLERFFDRSLPVRAALRDIVSSETRPLSDSQLAEQLSTQGFAIARRTVAKYRQMEGILPARLRHQNHPAHATP